MNETEKRIERGYYIRANNGEGFSVKAVYEVKPFGGDICRSFWFENGDGKHWDSAESAIKAYFNDLYFNGDIELDERDSNSNEAFALYLDCVNDIFFGDCDCLLCDNNHYAAGMFAAFDEIDVLFLKSYFDVDRIDGELLNMETVGKLTYPEVYLIEKNHKESKYQMISYARLKEKVERFTKILDEKKEVTAKAQAEADAAKIKAQADAEE